MNLLTRRQIIVNAGFAGAAAEDTTVYNPLENVSLTIRFGDGFSNILIPTQFALVGILAMAGIPYDRWLRFIMPFTVKIVIVG